MIRTRVPEKAYINLVPKEKHEIALKLLDWFAMMGAGAIRRYEASTAASKVRDLLETLEPVAITIMPWHTYDNFSIRVSMQFTENSGAYVDDLTFRFAT